MKLTTTTGQLMPTPTARFDSLPDLARGEIEDAEYSIGAKLSDMEIGLAWFRRLKA